MCPSAGALDGSVGERFDGLVVVPGLHSPDDGLCVANFGDPIVAAVDEAVVGLCVDIFMVSIFMLIILVELLFCCALDARKVSSSCN